LNLELIPPRILHYRNPYKIYILGHILLSALIVSFWSIRFQAHGFNLTLELYSWEIAASAFYFLASLSFYFFWLRARLQKSIQVFHDHLLIQKGKMGEEVKFSDIESVNIVCWSIFYIKMQSGVKYYFNSSIERVDYIWEGIYKERKDLLSQKQYEGFRTRLVQYDHHQKRKEWFFKHKMVDVLNWGVVPVMFVCLAFIFQSRNIVIHQQGVYFFRLFMYSMLVLLSTAFFYSILLKKLIFDKKVSSQLETEIKIRDLEFEGVVLQRSKIFQFITASFVLAQLVRMDVNLYSITKVKEDIASFKLKKGSAILIDNRFNCLGCKYQVKDGDFIVFGKGTIGQVLAKEGDMVGQIAQDENGRMIASENIQEVPLGHLAVKAANGKDIIFVKIEELIGKIQN
jgi:hypothetical protein